MEANILKRRNASLVLSENEIQILSMVKNLIMILYNVCSNRLFLINTL